jgi:branched-chain amino acid transport system substrate-binding protein
MNSKTTPLALLATAVTTAALVTGGGCARLAPGSAGARDTAFVGVAVGLDNPQRYVNVFHGVQLALDELNARRPAGAPVLAMRRASADARSHLDVATAFVRDSSVVGVVGHTESDPTIEAAAIYEDRAAGGRRALVAISPTANGTMVTRLNDWVFRVCPVGTRQAEALARYAMDSLGIHRFAVFYRNDASGKDFTRAFADEVIRSGGAVVERDPFVEAFPDFDAYAIRMTRRGVQAVGFVGNIAEARMALLALQAAGSSPVMLSTNVPGAADTAMRRAFRGVRYASLYNGDDPTDSAAYRFGRDFERAVGARPDQWGALSYDAAMLIGRAVHAEGANRRRVRDWVASVGRERPAYAGVTGTIRFDEHGDPIKRVPVRTVSE